MNIFAVIVTYNAMRRQWITKCLDALNNSSVKIIPVVVDNNSSDDTTKYIPQKYPNLIWLPQKSNLGFGKANNIGIKYALDNDADYILLINQDAFLEYDAINKMISFDDSSSVLSPVHLNGEGSNLDNGFLNMIAVNPMKIINKFLLDKDSSPCVEVGMVNAACWLLPAKIVKTIGGFNPLFFHYGEDNNYMHRLNYFNFKILLVTNAFMKHDRNEHGDMKMFYHKRLRRDFLLVATNINLNWKQRIKEYLKILKKCYFKYLPQNKYIIGEFLWERIRIMSQIHTIRKSRNIEKNIGLTWL